MLMRVRCFGRVDNDRVIGIDDAAFNQNFFDRWINRISPGQSGSCLTQIFRRIGKKTSFVAVIGRDAKWRASFCHFSPVGIVAELVRKAQPLFGIFQWMWPSIAATTSNERQVCRCDGFLVARAAYLQDVRPENHPWAEW